MKTTIDLNEATAAYLVQYNFNLKPSQFFITGSVAYGHPDTTPSDIDFCIRKSDFTALTTDNLWTESDYFPQQSYKLTIDGLVFNAIVLDIHKYVVWANATQALKKAPLMLKQLDKSYRYAIFEWLRDLCV